MAFSGFSAVTATPVLDTEEVPQTSACSIQPLEDTCSMSTSPVVGRRQPFKRPYVSRFREEFDSDSSDGDHPDGSAAGDNSSSGSLLDQSAEALEHDGAGDMSCASYNSDTQFEDLYRPHGIPLDTIDEISSDSDTGSIDALAKSYSRASRCRGRLFNRRSSSAPELCPPDETAHDFDILFPSLVRRSSSLHSPGPLSPLERSECGDSVRDAPSTLSSSSSPRPSSEGCRTTQSAPNLSPTKKRVAKTLGDIARILRGESSNDRTHQPTATWPGHGARLENVQRPTVISSMDSLEDAASGPSVGLSCLESTEPIDLRFLPQPLTVRNRSSLDSLPSGTSSCQKSGTGADGAHLSDSAPLFVQTTSPFGSREGFERCRYTADGVPIYNGSWPSLKSADLRADSAAIRQVSASPDSTILIQSRNLYEGTPRMIETNENLARPVMDNFTRLRLSGSSSTSDPFFDASENLYNQQGRLQASINALTRTSQIEPHRTDAPANLSLWPEPLRGPQIVHASPHRSPRRVSSHTGLLATGSNRPSHCADNMDTLVSRRTQCKHGKSVNRQVLLAGTKPTGRVGLNRGPRCAKCDWSSFKDSFQRGLSATLPSCRRRAAAHPVCEPLDSLEEVLMKTKRRTSIKTRPRAETPNPPVREWLAVPIEAGSPHRSAVNLGDGRGLVYVPRHSGNTPPASRVRCPHDKDRKCLRCSVSRAGRKALIWVTVTCFCQDIASDAGFARADARHSHARTSELRQAKRRSEIE